MSDRLSQTNNICLIIITAIAITSALIYTKGILVPFFISFCIFTVLAPLTKSLKDKLRLPHWAAMALVFILFVLFVSLISFIITGSIESFIKGADVYKTRIAQGTLYVGEWLQNTGIQINSQQISNFFKQLPILQQAQSVTGGLVTFMGNSFLITIFVLFLLAGQGAQAEIKSKLYNEAQEKISKYIIGKFLISLGTGVLVGIVLVFCGVDLALMFALLTILLNFIPSVGSLIATALPLPIVLLQYGLGWQFVTVLTLSAIIQISIGNVLEPKIMGESMDLHPITILIFLMFWGLVWGVPGMFLAVPITAILKIILARIETTQPVAELFAGRFSN